MKTLELNNISKTYVTEIGELEVLKNINFAVEKGEIIAIVGEYAKKCLIKFFENKISK